MQIVAGVLTLLLIAGAGVPVRATDACSTQTRLGDQAAGCDPGARVYDDSVSGLLLMYPSDWPVRIVNQTRTHADVELGTMNGSLDFESMRSSSGPESDAQEIQAIWAPFRGGDTTPITDTTVGGEPAKTFIYRFIFHGVPWTNQVWYLHHKGTGIHLFAAGPTARWPAIEPYIASAIFV